jgi:gamma-glutamyltranspeptidase/glutathione hydrolase
MLNILEGYDLKETGHNSPLYMHILTEVMRRAYADRARYLGDPDFNPDMPVKRLTSKGHAKKLRSSISLDRASVSDGERFNDVYETTETTHISVVDTHRNAVSLTYTLEESYGSKIVVEGAGFLLNNEMGDFNPIPGHTDAKGLIGTPPNLISPQKRMLSSMTPTILAKGGKPVMVIGTPGGRTIINTVLQVIVNVIDHGMNIAEAIEAGRFHHQWLPDITSIEKRAVTADLQKLYQGFGHKVDLVDAQGRAMGVFIGHDRGILSGAADSRSPDGAAVGY